MKLGTTLRSHAPEHFLSGEGPLRIADGARIFDLLEHLGIPPEEVRLIYRNHRLVGPSVGLADGDRVALFPPNFIHFSQFYLSREE